MKKWFITFLSLVLIFSCFIVPANAVTDSKESTPVLDASPQLSSQEDAVAYYLSQSEQDNFGGIYYDDDGILVVNTVGTTPSAAWYSQKNQEIGVRYQTVTYSLCDLEVVKDFLADYMDEYSILALDANEVTNQVDACLKSYSEDIMAQIEDLVQHQYPNMDCLHFEDYSGSSVTTTIGYEPSALSPSVSAAALPPSTNMTLAPGWEIKIGNYFYTLGPCVSTSIAYSAGHGFTSPASVTAGIIPITNPLGYNVGRAVGHFGGANKDWSQITAGTNITFSSDFKTVAIPPVVGKSVKMLGAVSHTQTGSITGTNMSIRVDGTTLTGMCAGNYLCAKGDSGAGIFDNTQPLRCHYGVQSSGVFNSSGQWAGISYFTPLA